LRRWIDIHLQGSISTKDEEETPPPARKRRAGKKLKAGKAKS
jgi:hypothetical protein